MHRWLLLGLIGCSGGGKDDGKIGPTDPSETDPDAPTYYADIAPLMNENCNYCHKPGAIAGNLEWDSYETVSAYKDAILDAVQTRRMPPFLADEDDDCAPRFPLVHDGRLPLEDVAVLSAWVEAGAPMGTPTEPLIPPSPPALEGWDDEVAPAKGYTAKKGDINICWAIPVDHIIAEGETRYLEALEVLPGDTSVTHHIQIQVDDDPDVAKNAGPEGYWDCTGIGSIGGTDFAGWLPGTLPVEMPEGVAVPVTSTSHITMQVHYHSVYDDDRLDLTKLRLRWSDEPPEREPSILRIGNWGQPQPFGGLVGDEFDEDPEHPKFLIPAGSTNHTEIMTQIVPPEWTKEWHAFMLTNHMHYVGVGATMKVIHADPQPGEPKEECLLNTPRYDPDWQGFFNYDSANDQAPRIRPGDVLQLTCTFDNSESNTKWMDQLALEGELGASWPFDVTLGGSTTDEMCLGMVAIVEIDEELQ